MNFKIIQLEALSDNYNYVICGEKGWVAAVDPSSDDKVCEWLKKQDLRLNLILNTHHHWDHVGGNSRLKEEFQCLIYGPYNEDIPGRTHEVYPEQILHFNNLKVQVLDVAAHTLGHVAYFFPSQGVLFCGDSLFAMGCGRLFEGTFKHLESSLDQIKSLPSETLVYSAHEYTQRNAEFALSVDPDNYQLQQRFKKVKHLRLSRRSTVPFLLGEELKTNPFLRPHDSEIRKNLNLGEEVSDRQVLARLRQLKDKF